MYNLHRFVTKQISDNIATGNGIDTISTSSLNETFMRKRWDRDVRQISMFFNRIDPLTYR